MLKYLVFGTLITFIIIFNLGYVFHEILMGDFFHKEIGILQREKYNIPVIAVAFLLYSLVQAYLLPVFYFYSKDRYHWTITKTAIVFGALLGFFWDGLQGGLIEAATFKMPFIVFWVDSGYHTAEGILTALILSVFYRKLKVG